jgi:prepilin-type N-terminal cleavage/methylation domain-containing protein
MHLQHLKLYNDQMGVSLRGFSLIEVLVSLSIFTIVVTISVGALMSIISANAKEQNAQSVMTNVTFALDSMTREIRTGTDYYCGPIASLPTSGNTTANCGGGAEGFSFNEGGDSLTKNESSNRIAFRMNNDSIERRLGDGDWEAITSPDVHVHILRFVTTGATRGDVNSPTLTLYVRGTAGVDDEAQSDFNIETTVVQQLLDI